MQTPTILVMSLATTLLLGCPAVMTVDGQTVVTDAYYRSLEQVKTAAEAEWSCSREQLKTKVLTRSVHATVDRFQVTGCGQDAVFALSSESSYALETTPPPPE